MTVTIKASELRVGDVVQALEGPWGTAIVKSCKNGYVSLYRPYGTNFDTLYSNGLICLTGLEQYEIPANNVLITVCRRQDNLK